MPAVWIYERVPRNSPISEFAPRTSHRPPGGAASPIGRFPKRTPASRPNRTEDGGPLVVDDPLGGASLSGATTGPRGGGHLHRRLAVVPAAAHRAWRSVLGDPREREIDPATLAQWRTAYGLDRPILEQYIRFLGQAAVGNFGPSIRFISPSLMSSPRRSRKPLPSWARRLS